MLELTEGAGVWGTLMQLMAWAVSLVGACWEWLKVGLSLIWAASGMAIGWLLAIFGLTTQDVFSSVWTFIKIALAVLVGLFVLMVVIGFMLAPSKPGSRSGSKG